MRKVFLEFISNIKIGEKVRSQLHLIDLSFFGKNFGHNSISRSDYAETLILTNKMGVGVIVKFLNDLVECKISIKFCKSKSISC